ncbi:MAG: SUMF1/EgtB/PvdO family nonheme iron enzyme [Thermoanaerobaculia bacterium]
MRHPAWAGRITREQLIEWYRAGRARSRRLFQIPHPEAYFDRPIALRNPIVFYEGHLPAFCVNTLLKSALKQSGINGEYEQLFERGIDPEDETVVKSPGSLWPARGDVQAYGAAVDAAIEKALRCERIEDDAVPQLRAGEAALCIIEHELMHQETLLYMFHNMSYDRKVPQKSGVINTSNTRRETKRAVTIPAGAATLGTTRGKQPFGWDNEFDAHQVEVEAFTIDRYSVTNGDYLACMNATGAPPPHFWLRRDGQWFWRGMFELVPLPLDWPVWVSHDEAAAFARWKGGRLPSEAEYDRAAFATPQGREVRFPWGDELPDASRGNFDFQNWDPMPVGSYPAGASAWGVHDLAGNGWEWTSTVFNAFPGFEPMSSYPVYSTDFFDGQHYVLKGASPVTGRELVRRTFRNWFRPGYPYVFAKFRCVS